MSGPEKKPTAPGIRITFLRYLADYPGACSADFAQWAPVSRPTRGGKQSWAGEVLRRLEKHGLVTRAPGREYEIGDRHQEARGVEKRYVSQGMKKPQPSHAWWLTDAGISYLQQVDARVAAKAEAARSAEESRRLSVEREAALASARASCGAGTSRVDRKEMAHALRDLGCTLDQIGAVFGVTREMIRKDLLWDPAVDPPRVRKPPKEPRLRSPLAPFNLSLRQAEMLLCIYLRQPDRDYSHFITTGRALNKRGLIQGGKLTAEGEGVARELHRLAAASQAQAGAA